jgi:hypothetical protein
LKEVDDGVGRLAALEGLGEGICGEVYLCLLSIFHQGGIENGLKVSCIEDTVRGVHCAMYSSVDGHNKRSNGCI